MEQTYRGSIRQNIVRVLGGLPAREAFTRGPHRRRQSLPLAALESESGGEASGVPIECTDSWPAARKSGAIVPAAPPPSLLFTGPSPRYLSVAAFWRLAALSMDTSTTANALQGSCGDHGDSGTELSDSIELGRFGEWLAGFLIPALCRFILAC